MSYISEKVAYLDGLAEGQGIENDKYGKLFKGIIDALGAIADELEEQDAAMDDLSDCVDEIYDELDDVQDMLDEDGDFDDDFVETTCPHCGETVYFDADMLDNEGGLICPNCNETIELDIPECECGDGCECGCSDKPEEKE